MLGLLAQTTGDLGTGRKTIGKGLVIVEGRRVYMVAAFGSKPHDRKAAVDRFMKSFKFQAPDKKNQDPPKVAKTKAKAKADDDEDPPEQSVHADSSVSRGIKIAAMHGNTYFIATKTSRV